MSLNSGKKELMEMIYGTVDNIVETSEQEIKKIPLELIDDLADQEHPFSKSLNMEIGIDDLSESIKMLGVLQPIILVPTDDRYVCLSGHRRRRAAAKAGLKSIPAIIKKDINPDIIDLIVTDTNLQNRKNFFPSEIAKAFYKQINALKRQGARNDLVENVEVICNEDISGGNTAREIIAERYHMAPTEISKYIRLLKLNRQLLSMVDDGYISVRAGYTLSFLDSWQQDKLNGIGAISIKEAQEIRKITDEEWQNIEFIDGRAIKHYIKEKSKRPKRENPSVVGAIQRCRAPFKEIVLPTIDAEAELANLIEKTIKRFMMQYEQKIL